jgi:2-methylisocitrate lyase-like PEP mutase family enzyme
MIFAAAMSSPMNHTLYEDVLDRLYAYKEAGADMLIAGGEFTLEQFADMGKKFPYQTCINAGLYPFPNCDLPVEKWREIQIGLLFYPLVGLNAAGKAVQDALTQLKSGQITRDYFQEHCFTLMETNGYVDYPDYMAKEKEFSVEA